MHKREVDLHGDNHNAANLLSNLTLNVKEIELPSLAEYCICSSDIGNSFWEPVVVFDSFFFDFVLGEKIDVHIFRSTEELAEDIEAVDGVNDEWECHESQDNSVSWSLNETVDSNACKGQSMGALGALKR